MPVSDGYLEYVVELLECAGEVSARKMFGGAGLYLDGLFFALVSADDVLYFKVDDSNRGEFEAAGCEPFRPFNEKKAMGYYRVPDLVLEESTELKRWAEKALKVAANKKTKKRHKK